MTREEVFQMEEGKEMDTLIAERVMGWHIVKRENWSDIWEDAEGRYQHHVSSDDYGDDEDFHLIRFHPSESILWAWEVVEKLNTKAGITAFNIWRYEDNDWRCQFVNRHQNETIRAETAPLAICRTALLAVMELENA